ncbi:hypothetical protein BJ165DRAFT_1610672 [Panaeolus papilionaceus]|nr:hypothetical protein BJ165DRAFT_1610672 [Panaeolus papilionaceus]
MRRSKSTLDIFDLILYTLAFATLISSTYSMVVFESELRQLEPRDTTSTPTPTPTDPYSYYTSRQSLYMSKINSLVNEYFKLRKATIIVGVLFGLLSLTMCFVTRCRTPKKVPDMAEELHFTTSVQNGLPPVSINASIDGYPPMVWNLQGLDPNTNPQPPGPQPRIITPNITDPGPPTFPWGIVGSFVGLDHGTHAVQIWFDKRWSSMAVIDSYMITTLEDVDSTSTTQSSSTSIATSMVPTGILSPQGSQYLEKIQAIYPEYERLRKSTIAVSVLFAFSFIGTSFVTWARMVQRRDRLNATIHAGDDEEGDPNPATYLDGMAEEKDND